MRKLFWAFSGLTVPAAVVLLGRGLLDAGEPRGFVNDPALRQTGEVAADPGLTMPVRTEFPVTASAWPASAFSA